MRSSKRFCSNKRITKKIFKKLKNQYIKLYLLSESDEDKYYFISFAVELNRRIKKLNTRLK